MLMTVLTERKKVRFISGDTECAAWHYPGTNGACVIMAGGGAVTKEPGTDLFARRFHEAGFNVLAFDYRRLGESGGQPRQVIRIREQLTDWQAAIAFAAGLPGVDPTRLAIWGFSLSGGHVFRVAADNPQLVLVCDRDQTALAGPAVGAANRASRGELVQLPGGHYELFLGQHEQAIEAELSFLRRHLLDNPLPDRAAPAEFAPTTPYNAAT